MECLFFSLEKEEIQMANYRIPKEIRTELKINKVL